MFHSPKKELQSWVQNLDNDLIIHNKFVDVIWHLSPIMFYHSQSLFKSIDTLYLR
jgi:hypothetical protein